MFLLPLPGERASFTGSPLPATSSFLFLFFPLSVAFRPFRSFPFCRVSSPRFLLSSHPFILAPFFFFTPHHLSSLLPPSSSFYRRRSHMAGCGPGLPGSLPRLNSQPAGQFASAVGRQTPPQRKGKREKEGKRREEA